MDARRILIDEMDKVQQYLLKLSRGIDPTCNMEFSSDTILTNERIKSKLQRASELISDYRSLIQKEARCRVNRRAYIKFFLTADEAKDYDTIPEPVTISKLTYSLNGRFRKDEVSLLKATDITAWLEVEGYLRSVQMESGQINRIPTEKGTSIGISCEEKTNSNNQKYYTNYYNEEAQRFVVEHLVIT